MNAEASRVAALRALRLLDTPPEERFDRIARLAQRTFGVPIVVISLIDDNRVWFKSRMGLAETQMPRDGSFCDDTILGDAQLVVPDATKDPRFAMHPLVAGGPKIRFYAGQPLKGPDGSLVGTMSLLDTQTRNLDNEQRRALRDLAEMAEEQLASSPGREPADEHTRLLQRLRLSPEHTSAMLRIRGVFLALMVVLLVVTGLTLRLAGRLVRDADTIAQALSASKGEANLPIAGLQSTARFFRAGIGARALLATGMLLLILIIFDRHMDGRLSAMAAVELDHARLRSVLFAIGDGVVVADAQGRFTMFNPAAERILGLGLVDDPDDTGRFYLSFFTEAGTTCPPDKHPLARAIAGESAHNFRLIVRNERRPGGVPVLITATPVHALDGSPGGGVIVFRDVL